MENRNRLNLNIIPVGGVDKSIDCSKCPSACCRAGMAIPLTGSEAEALRDAGTDLRKMAKKETKGQPAGRGRQHYELMSNCGNLVADPDSGSTSCAVHETDQYPTACREFKMGGYACGLVQLARIHRGEDVANPDQPPKV